MPKKFKQKKARKIKNTCYKSEFKKYVYFLIDAYLA